VHRATANVDAFGLQECRADAGGHQFAIRHHARAQAITDFADEMNAFGAASQVGEVPVEFGFDMQANVARKVHVTALDLVHDRTPSRRPAPCRATARDGR
jgi:hypothetical protein